VNRHAYADAAAQALQALDIDSRFPLASLGLARAYAGMGRHDEAIALMEAQADTPIRASRRCFVG
jgi:hypothetical protein